MCVGNSVYAGNMNACKHMGGSSRTDIILSIHPVCICHNTDQSLSIHMGRVYVGKVDNRRTLSTLFSVVYSPSSISLISFLIAVKGREEMKLVNTLLHGHYSYNYTKKMVVTRTLTQHT